MRNQLITTVIFNGLTVIASGLIVNGAGAAETAPGVSRLLNKANAMNYEEIELAKLARDKASDNQALKTFAQTLESDHKANEDAVTTLSRQENVTLNGTPASIEVKYKRMESLDGADFNRAFLRDSVKDHSEALAFFEADKRKFRNDPNIYRYVEETIPVLRSHLEMARTLEDESD
jgi:putative membrane protein